MNMSETTRFKPQADLFSKELLDKAGYGHLSMSDAMLRGAKMLPQCYGALFTYSQNEFTISVVSSCAYGAAIMGWGYPAGTPLSKISTEHLTRIPDNTTIAVTHLNDTYRWSREKIAMYLKEHGF